MTHYASLRGEPLPAIPIDKDGNCMPWLLCSEIEMLRWQLAIRERFLSAVGCSKDIVMNQAKQAADFDPGHFHSLDECACKRAVCAAAVDGEVPMLGGESDKSAALGFYAGETSPNGRIFRCRF